MGVIRHSDPLGFRMIRKAEFIVGLSLLLGVESKKAFNKKKYNNTGIMEAKAELTVLSSVIDTLKAEVALLEECVKTPSEEACVAPPDERTSTAEVKDLMFAASQYMNTGDRCGPQELTNCASTLNVADDSITAATITSNSATYVNAGSCIFTAPNIPGYYNICFHARFKGVRIFHQAPKMRLNHKLLSCVQK